MAKRNGESELKKIEEKLDVKNTEYDVVISLFLAYRSIKAWSKMIDLVGKDVKAAFRNGYGARAAGISIKQSRAK